ncbi:MAG TPA: hypothetical protein VKK06_19240 [Terriglobia bacterium]|nr:hypothetical protein [Terriglobia bacterium]
MNEEGRIKKWSWREYPKKDDLEVTSGVPARYIPPGNSDRLGPLAQLEVI